MDNLFVDYKTSKTLKDKDFNVECFAHWGNIKKLNHVRYSNESFKFLGWISAPTHQQVIDWFRDKHGIMFSISPGHSAKWYNVSVYGITKKGHKIALKLEEIFFGGVYDCELKSYYEALNTAFTEALKLI